MTRYSIIFTREFQRSIKKLDVKLREEILAEIEVISINPRPTGAKKLKTNFACYRIRHGDCRIIYEIHDGQVAVLILDVGDRGRIYKKSYSSLIHAIIRERNATIH